MEMFAEYEPQVRSSLNYHVQLMPATQAHLKGVSLLIGGRTDLGGDALITWLEATMNLREHRRSISQLFVALYDDAVVGCGGCMWHSDSVATGKEVHHIPEGWYLRGVRVDPAFRRQGIGRRLCEAIMLWAKQRTDVVYNFVDTRNEASIRLHTQLGFKDISRYAAHNVSSYFPGKDQILLKADLK